MVNIWYLYSNMINENPAFAKILIWYIVLAIKDIELLCLKP